MGVRYRNTFYSLAGIQWQIDIIDSSYTGSVNLFGTGPGGFSLSYKGVTERIDPIMASTLSVPVIITDSTIEAFITSTMTAQEEQYTVKIYKGVLLDWVGVLLPDQVQKEDIGYPYIVDLTFTDGLARLRDIDYNTGGLTPVAYTGRDSIFQHFIKILSKTGITSLYGTYDIFLTTAVNWYDVRHVYGLIYDPLNYTDLSHAIFYEYDDDGIITYKKTYEVLEMILRTFNAQIKMANGRFYIIQPQEYARPTTYVRTYSKTGYILSNTTTSFRQTPVNNSRKTGGTTKYYPPVNKVVKKYKPKVSPNINGSLLPIVSVYYPAVNFLNMVPGTSVLNITGNVRELFALDDPFGSPVSLYSKWKLIIVLTPLAGGSNYYLTNKSGYYQWTTISSDYVTINGPVTGGWGWDRTWPFSITTPAVPSDSDGTFSFQLINLYKDNGVVFPIGDNQYRAEYHQFTLSPDFTAEAASTDDIIFTAVNMVGAGISVNSTVELNIPDTFIGDGPDVMHIGKLKVNDGSVWNDSTAWGVHNTTTRVNINQLSVNENLKGQRVPTAKYAGAFITTVINAVSSIAIGAMVFVPIMVTINPAIDEISGEWFNVIIPVT